MADGYFIGQGDKTTCGGQVLDGDARINLYGVLHAREGDRVTCGKDGGTYRIVGGISHMESHGRLMAGTLDSFSDCPCRARLIPSVFTATYRNQGGASHARRAPVQADTSTSTRRPVASSSHPAPAPFSRIEPQEPGFYIVPKSTTREQLEADLFTLRDPAVMGKFKLLNPNLHDVKAGSMIVLGDPGSGQCTREEALLMKVADQTHQLIASLSPDEADFMVQHRAQLQSFLALGSSAVGVGKDVLHSNLNNVKYILESIDVLHQYSFAKDGHLRSPEFFAQRKQLLAQLDIHMTALTRKGIGFPDHPHLKKALGISNRSLVHHWTQAGGPGQIPGYATHLDGVARASQYIKYGGWLGTAVGGGASALKVREVCSAGDAEACERVRLTETGDFFGGIVGGAALGGLVVKAASGLCIALGLPSAGTVPAACSIALIAAGSLSASNLGSWTGEKIGDVIYEVTR